MWRQCRKSKLFVHFLHIRCCFPLLLVESILSRQVRDPSKVASYKLFSCFVRRTFSLRKMHDLWTCRNAHVLSRWQLFRTPPSFYKQKKKVKFSAPAEMFYRKAIWNKQNRNCAIKLLTVLFSLSTATMLFMAVSEPGAINSGQQILRTAWLGQPF